MFAMLYVYNPETTQYAGVTFRRPPLKIIIIYQKRYIVSEHNNIIGGMKNYSSHRF